MLIRISANKTARWLAVAILFLVVAHVAGQLSRFLLGYDHIRGLVPLFNLELEANAPTWFSSSLLLVAAALFAVIAVGKRNRGDRYVRHWLVLAIVFVLLSLDEAGKIHELSISVFRGAFQTGGLLYYAWIIPAGIFVLIMAVAYLRFFLDLPGKIRNVVLLAALLYVGGAMGLEMVEGLLNEQGRYMDPTYTALVTIEETLEMSGVAVLIYGLLSYMRQQEDRIEIAIGE